MKNLVQYITESKALFPITQYETGKEGGYSTFNVSKEMKQYKYGFVTFNKDNEFVSITAFNDPNEYCDIMGYKEDSLGFLENAQLYKSFKGDDGSLYLRIW